MKKLEAAEKAYVAYTKATAKLHKDAIPDEPLPPFYHSPEYLEQWGKITERYNAKMRALGFPNY